jgi:quercetin dioxygenase-like cupin family protein
MKPGQALGDHQVKEAALLLVVDGQVRIEAGGESLDATAGMLCRFDPDERHAVSADGEARVLLVLAPWPADGHYYPGERAGSGASASSPDAA